MTKFNPDIKVSDLANKPYIARIKNLDLDEFDESLIVTSLNGFKQPKGWNLDGNMCYLYGKYVVVWLFGNTFQTYRHLEYVNLEDRSSCLIWSLSLDDISDIWEIDESVISEDHRSQLDSVIGSSLSELRDNYPWLKFKTIFNPGEDPTDGDTVPAELVKIQLEPSMTKSQLENLKAKKLSTLLDVYALKPKYHAMKIREIATEIRFIDKLLTEMK